MKYKYKYEFFQHTIRHLCRNSANKYSPILRTSSLQSLSCRHNDTTEFMNSIDDV